MEEVEKVRDERLKAWVAALAKSGPIAAPVSPPPAQDLSQTQLFPTWEIWSQFLISPPAIPALSRVLDAVIRIARIVDVKVPKLAADIVAAITRARQHRQDTPQAREALITLKILAVTDTLQQVYACVPETERLVDLDAVLANMRENAISRNNSSNFDHHLDEQRVKSDVSMTTEERHVSPLEPTNIGMPVQFVSVRSLGLTDHTASAASLGADDPYGATCNSDHADNSNRLNPQVVAQSWSATALNAPSPVEQAAGSLYSSAPVDDLWIIGDSIGVGNFSYVHHVTSVVDQTRAAIKIICKGAPDLFADGDVCREVAAFSHLGQHDAVVKCLQVLEDDRFVYIVMELLTGGQLLPRVADSGKYGQFGEASARDIARNIARGLAHCHALGVAHRDVKPENILFASENGGTKVKLTDFGIAHILRQGEEGDLEMVGTPLYVAPEVLLRKPYGCAADMWSLGVIVHILLTGFPPFDDDNIVALINKVKTGVLRYNEKEWEDVSSMAKDFVVGLLKRNPRERMTAAQAMLHPWLRANIAELERNISEIRRDSSASVLRNSQPPSRQGSLQSVQTNLATFVKRRDSRPQIGSSHKLSLLVSLSERKLKGIPSEGVVGTGNTSKSNASRSSVAAGHKTASMHRGGASRNKYSSRGTSDVSSWIGAKDSRKIESSPKRKDSKRGSSATTRQASLPVEMRLQSLNHSEFTPSYKPTAYDTEKLHEMDNAKNSSRTSKPTSPVVAPSTSNETDKDLLLHKSKTQVSASISATTATPPASACSSGECRPSSPNGVSGTGSEKDAMDQSNVHLVKLDESLKARREADAESHTPLRTKTGGFLRTGTRKTRRRQNSLTPYHLFRRSTAAETKRTSR